MMFLDGGGVGGGVVDRVKQLVNPQKVREINFGSTPKDTAKYFNKRAEMWGVARDAIRAGIELPEDNELLDELCAVEYGFSSKQQIQLERKEDMKKRGLASPDCADAFVLTYAENVLKNRSAPIRQRYACNNYGSTNWMGV